MDGKGVKRYDWFVINGFTVKLQFPKDASHGLHVLFL